MPKAFELNGSLETERLILRAFEPGDLGALFAMHSNPEVTRLLYWDARTEAETRDVLDKKIAATTIRTEGDVLALAVVLKETGEVVGDVVLWLASRAHRQGEVGFIVHPDHQGHGYATEAARPLLRIAFEELGLHRVVGRLEARNAASGRVLEKLGMRKEAHLVENELVKGEWQSEIVYAMLDREWRASPG
jgi:RimJ/RimL family protein N-acetyltransferase